MKGSAHSKGPAGPVVVLWAFAVMGLTPLARLHPLVSGALGERTNSLLGGAVSIPAMLSLVWAFLTDRVPLFGTRREAYLMLGGIISVAGWVALTLIPPTYVAWFDVVLFLTLGSAITLAAARGALADAGHRLAATGAMAAATMITTNLAFLASAWGASIIDTRGAIGVVGGILALSLVAAVVVGLVRGTSDQPFGPPKSTATPADLEGRPERLASYLLSRRFWSVLVVGVLSQASEVPRRFVQQPLRGLVDLPDDVLRLNALISVLSIVVAGIAYGYACRRIAVRVLLPVSLLAGAVGTLGFLAVPGGGGAFLYVAFAGAGVGHALATVSFLDVVLRSVPRGSESIGILVASGVPAFVGSVLLAPLAIQTRLPISTLSAVAAGCTAIAALVAQTWIPRLLTVAPEAVEVQRLGEIAV